ncbi:MAG TPA: UDP-N-acetylmuramyl-tripeptide synthetase [Candidatus Paceibacterota bacterium]|nr:UDP-N-acetylmuramyl-tripeptide synthetase [Candidatus Paceibacterota bacterium]HMP18971.1 UDP-N-acetylmuramyl-tripeptide synthetase [Candidatus Paceibacterota bacterium]
MEIEKILRKIEKIIPKKIFRATQPIYHYLLTLLGAIIYRFPARKLFIIGITGTKGKSTTTEIVNAILEEAGYKTALSNTIRFKIDKDSKANKYKMSMPGRFFMQKFLRQAVKNGCTHAVVEITSEGSKQFRHKFIWLDAFIFTNLAPEHIESHGSYEKYREAKLRIADNVKKKNGIVIVNGDDEESEMFLNRTNVTKKIKFSLTDAKPIRFGEKTEMRFKKNTLYSPLPGEFNVYNILASATLAEQIGISDEIIKTAVEKLSEIPGRVQKVKVGQDFDVIVDYAHTAESLEELYKAFPNRRKICILGNTGGGRDKWKRPIMAKVAEKYCDEIILANEDPYDEDPFQIVQEMKDAISDSTKSVKIILDRRQAISEAVKKAQKNDIVLISGKGTDPYIMEANGQKTPWSDFEIAKEEILKQIKK